MRIGDGADSISEAALVMEKFNLETLQPNLETKAVNDDKLFAEYVSLHDDLETG